MERKILDMTCSARSMWFEKDNAQTVYMDKRQDVFVYPGNKVVNIDLQIVGSFSFLPFQDSSFHLVVFDPPHIEGLNTTAILAQKYGTLFPSWREEIKEGFSEALRVLKTNGILIFKWNERQVGVKEVLELSDCKPLFGHPTGKNGKTKWISFMK